jgi:hypothetical protein
MESEVLALMEYLMEACKSGARFIEYHDAHPEELRAWAARIDSGLAPNAVSLPARMLRRAAAEALRFIDEERKTR